MFQMMLNGAPNNTVRAYLKAAGRTYLVTLPPIFHSDLGAVIVCLTSMLAVREQLTKRKGKKKRQNATAEVIIGDVLSNDKVLMQPAQSGYVLCGHINGPCFPRFLPQPQKVPNLFPNATALLGSLFMINNAKVYKLWQGMPIAQTHHSSCLEKKERKSSRMRL